MRKDIKSIEAELDEREKLIAAVKIGDCPSITACQANEYLKEAREPMFFNINRDGSDSVEQVAPWSRLGFILMRVPEDGWAARAEDWRRRMIEHHVTAVRATRGAVTCPKCSQVFEIFGSLAPGEACPACEWAAFRVAHREKQVAEFHRMNPRARYYCGLKGSPPKPEQFNAVQQWNRYADEFSDQVISLGLILIGDSFRGKTTAIMHRLQRGVADGDWEGDGVLCIGPEVINSIPGRALDGSLPELIGELNEAQALLLDDLDKARFSPRVATELLSLVESRLREHEAPLFITMNTRTKRDFLRLFLNKDGDAKQIGLSIYNRLAQACQFVDFDA